MNPASAGVGSAGVSVTVTGSNFIPTSTVQWNGNALTTSYTSSTSLTAQVPASDLLTEANNIINVMNPAPGGGLSASLTFVVNAAATASGFYFKLPANDLAWDPVNQVIYLSLPSSVGANGNTVQAVNPSTGALGTSAFVGSEPNLLAVSKSSEYLYVSLNGASNVVRLTLPGLGSNLTIPLGSDSFYGPLYAMDLEASPMSDGTVAVVRKAPTVSPAEEGGVLIYDDGTARSQVLCGWIESGCTHYPSGLYDSIQWNADGSEMFAANNEDTGFDFYTVPVTSAGFGSVTDYGGLAGGFGENIHYSPVTGDVYDDNGSVIDPIAGDKVGTFNASGLMVPDGTLGTAFFLGQTQSQLGGTTYTLESFDIQKFTPIAGLLIENVIGNPTHLIRWGSNGLAFTTSSGGGSSSAGTGAVYFVSGSFVDGSANGVKAPVQNVQRTWK